MIKGVWALRLQHSRAACIPAVWEKMSLQYNYSLHFQKFCQRYMDPRKSEMCQRRYQDWKKSLLKGKEIILLFVVQICPSDCSTARADVFLQRRLWYGQPWHWGLHEFNASTHQSSMPGDVIDTRKCKDCVRTLVAQLRWGVLVK